MPTSVASSDDEDEQEKFILDIEELTNHGIQQADIKKLRDANYWTISMIHSTMTKHLIKVRGLSEIKAEKIKDAAKKCMPAGGGLMTGTQVMAMRKRCFRLSTGSKQWDSILNGGFQSMSISEVYGEWRCGKTQLAHTLSVVAQLPRDQGGAAGKVAYLDTEGTFRPERIMQIAERYGLDPELAIDNITYSRALNSENQTEQLNSMMENLASGDYRLLVVDSVVALFRADYTGRGELNERQQKLNNFLSRLTKTSEEFNVVVFMTNQVQSDPGASALFAGVDGRKPVGGHIFAHASTTRVLLRKGRGDERVAKIQDSPDCPEREATYIITTGGINDPEKA